MFPSVCHHRTHHPDRSSTASARRYSDEPSTDGRPEGLPDEAVQSSFSLDYLKDMRPVFPNEGHLEFTLGDNLPLDLAFSLADGSVDVQYHLAPRIQS
jgi:hypothetical protein